MTAPAGLKPADSHPTMTSAADRRTSAPREQMTLDRRYGAIGISAVAAALRYGGAGKNPAYAQAPENARLDARLQELSVA
jgi:hypothetical protein